MIWGDNEDSTLRFWVDTICRLQRQSETAIPTTTSVAGLPWNDGINLEDTIMWDNTSLSYLNDLSHLSTFANDLLPWGVDPHGYYEPSTHPFWQQMTSAETPEGSLGVCV